MKAINRLQFHILTEFYRFNKIGLIALTLIFGLLLAMTPVALAQQPASSGEVAEIKQAMLDTMIEYTSFSPAEIADWYSDTMLAVMKLDSAPDLFVVVSWKLPNHNAANRAEQLDIDTFKVRVFTHTSSEGPYERRGESSSSRLSQIGEAPINYHRYEGAHINPNLPRAVGSYFYSLMRPTRIEGASERQNHLFSLHNKEFLPHAQKFKDGPIWESFVDKHNMRCREEVGHQFSWDF